MPDRKEPETTREKKLAAGLRWSVPAMLIAGGGGLAAGYFNTHFVQLNDHVTVEAMVTLSLGAVIAGVLCPRIIWASALAAGLGLPAVHLFVQVMGVDVPRPVGLHASDFLLLVPALLCAAGGAGWRLFLSHPITKDPKG